ncbi:MAG: hypothetical protein ABMA01_19635 [Chthoniobacteraceae bacterium]
MTATLPALERLKPNPAWASLPLFDRTGWKRVVRAYQDFKDEPGFTRVVPSAEIRAKEGNLSIPLYVGGETQAQTDAAPRASDGILL